MKVFVVMGNDFPDGVFASEAAAEAFIAEKEKAAPKPQYGPRIHWRVYEFEVRK